MDSLKFGRAKFRMKRTNGGLNLLFMLSTGKDVTIAKNEKAIGRLTRFNLDYYLYLEFGDVV